MFHEVYIGFIGSSIIVFSFVSNMRNFLFWIIAIGFFSLVACNKEANEEDILEDEEILDNDEQKNNTADGNKNGNNTTNPNNNDNSNKIDSTIWRSYKDSFCLGSYKDSTYWLSYRSDSNHVTVEEWVPDGSGSLQGFDVFGDYLFGFFLSLRDVKISDLRNRKCLGLFPSGMDVVYSRHANCQNFTSSYYSDEDLIPLLLVSGNESRDGVDLRGVSYLMRLKVEGSSFKAELAQTISTVPGTYLDTDGKEYSFGLYNNIMVDRETGHFYVINGSSIYEMEQPALFDGSGRVISEAELTVEKVIRRIGFKYKSPSAQGACINNGLAYIASGTGKGYLQVVDLSSGKELKSFYLPDIGYELEPEDIAFWRGSMILSGGVSRGIYRVYWE